MCMPIPMSMGGGPVYAAPAPTPEPLPPPPEPPKTATSIVSATDTVVKKANPLAITKTPTQPPVPSWGTTGLNPNI